MAVSSVTSTANSLIVVDSGNTFNIQKVDIQSLSTVNGFVFIRYTEGLVLVPASLLTQSEIQAFLDATSSISGTVSVDNFPAIQTVDGTVSVDTSLLSTSANQELLLSELELKVNSTDIPKTAFGELSIAQDTVFVQSTAVYGFIPNNFRVYTSLGGTTGVTDRMFTVTTGTTTFGFGAIQSFRALNYNAGQGGSAKFTALFQNNVANSWTGVGLVNLSDELSFGYNGTTFGCWHRYGGIAAVRTLTINVASSGSTNLTLTLNSVAYTIPLTAGTTSFNAYQVAAWLNANQAIWVADQIENTVIISALSDGAKSGTYSYSHDTSTGTIATTKVGSTKTSVHIPQSTWNQNTASFLDATKGNVYKIDFQYLGFGAIKYYVENPETGSFILVHVIKWANANILPSLNQPSLRFGMYGASIGSTTNLTIQCASVNLAVQGKVFKTRNPRAVKNTQTVNSSFTNILTLRNRRTYNGINNQVEIEPISVSLSSESTKNIEVEIRTNAVFSGSTNFTNTGTNLVGDVDVTANTTSNGILLASFTLSGGASTTINLKDYEIRIPPSLSLTIGARVTSGASSNVTGALTYYEDL